MTSRSKTKILFIIFAVSVIISFLPYNGLFEGVFLHHSAILVYGDVWPRLVKNLDYSSKKEICLDFEPVTLILYHTQFCFVINKMFPNCMDNLVFVVVRSKYLYMYIKSTSIFWVKRPLIWYPKQICFEAFVFSIIKEKF